MNSLANQFRRWYEYEINAHHIAIDYFDSVPESNRGKPEYQRAIDKFAHVAAARQMWLFRFGYLDEKPGPVFPVQATLEQLTDSLNQTQRLWTAFLSTITDERISEPFEYSASEGGKYRNTMNDILVQLHGHSLYHLGQIATLIKLCGGEPVDTDFVFWSRKKVE